MLFGLFSVLEFFLCVNLISLLSIFVLGDLFWVSFDCSVVYFLVWFFVFISCLMVDIFSFEKFFWVVRVFSVLLVMFSLILVVISMVFVNLLFGVIFVVFLKLFNVDL